jgi:tetratricopeptide (TPR) repeat protein
MFTHGLKFSWLWFIGQVPTGRGRLTINPSPAPMPAAAYRSGIWKGIAVAAIGLVCVAGGWWLGQLQNGAGSADQARLSLERQVSDLQQRLNLGEASAAEQQRLLELLIGLDRKAEATALLERLADQQPQRWPLRLLLAELRRDQKDLSGAEREVRQLLNLRPDQIEGLQLLALLQVETGRNALAQTQLEAALNRASKPQLKPEALSIGLLLANVLQTSGRPAQADAVLIKLAASFPADQRPLLARALLQKDKGDHAGAQQSLAQARSRQPGSSDPRLDQVAAEWGLTRLKEPSPSPPVKPTGN